MSSDQRVVFLSDKMGRVTYGDVLSERPVTSKRTSTDPGSGVRTGPSHPADLLLRQMVMIRCTGPYSKRLEVEVISQRSKALENIHLLALQARLESC